MAGANNTIPTLLVEHATRCWEAECENAERLVGRMKLLTSISAVLIGVGFYKVNWTYGSNDHPVMVSPWLVYPMRVILLFGLSFLSASFWIMISRSRRRPNPTASWYLYLGTDTLNNLPGTANELELVAFERIHRAYVELARGNERLDSRMRTALICFKIGLAWVFLAIFLYIASSVPPIMTDSTHEQRTSHHDTGSASSGDRPVLGPAGP